MHILIIPSWYRSSKADTQGSFFREQAFALAKRGYQIGIIHPQHRSMRQWRSTFSGQYGFDLEIDKENNEMGDVFSIPTLRMHTMAWFPRQIPYLNYWLWVRNGLKLYRHYVKRFGTPDAIHAHTMVYGGLLAWNIQRRHGIPFAITEHGTAYARNLFAPWELKLASQAAADADARLAVSETFCQELNGFIGSQWTPCANVVPTSFTDCALPQTEKEPFIFTAVAYLSPRKGIHHLISAFAKAFKTDQTAVLRIGGDGKIKAELAALAQQLGIAEQVVFLGALDRAGVRSLVAKTDVFVLASQYEPFGVVVIEALALGKPVIATRCGGPNQVVREQDGLLVEPENVEAMAAALRYMKTNSSRYDAQEIRQSCIERYGEDALVKRLAPIYRRISTQTQQAIAQEPAQYA